MRKLLRIFGLFAILIAAKQGVAQTRPSALSLCDLQVQVAQGEHRPVQVEAVFLAGLEGQGLVNAGCSGRITSVEFELKTQQHERHLWRLVDRTNNRKHRRGDGDPVLVVFAGEFFGPPLPDPKLPEQIRKVYHPAWGNGGEMTKLIVNSILSVRALPADHPCAPPKSNPNQWPCLQHDPLSHQEDTPKPSGAS
jgi:hypothetical protein